MSRHRIPKMYRKDDMIYHYTSARKAFSILKEMKLRLSSRSKSNDPIENTDYFFTFSGTGDEAGANKLANKAKSLLRNTKQVCFCMNAKERELGIISLPFFEKYGFAKPRMWEQYGNRYKGVCLAFSLKDLQAQAFKNRFLGNELNYLTYEDSEISHRSIDTEAIKTMGYKKYEAFFLKYLNDRLFNKHKDYIG